MKIMELLLETAQSDINQSLNKAVVMSKKDPETTPFIKSRLEKLLQYARSKVSKAPPPVAEDSALVFDVIDISEELKKVLAYAGPELQKVIYADLNKMLQQAASIGAADAEKSTQQYFSGIESVLKPLVAKVSGHTKVQAEVKAQLEGWFNNLVLRDRKVSKDDMLAFLKEAADGHIIDMARLVKQDSGNVENFVNPKFKGIFALFQERIFQYKPGGSGANIGPGEVAFTLLGNPAEKAAIGDIRVDGVMYEVKGGNNNKGGRMNSKQVKSPNSAWPWIVSFFDKNISTVKPVFKTKENKLAMKYNWNPKGITLLNQDVSAAIPNKAKRTKVLLSFLDGLWKFMIMNHDQIKNTDKLIAGMIDTSTGTIDVEQAIRNVTHLLYESYRLSDGDMSPGSKTPQMNIIVVNTKTLNYQIIRSAKDLNKIDIKSGIAWNDANTSASPQIYIS